MEEDCFSSIFGVSLPIPPEDGMLFEQFPFMLFEDGFYMLYE